MSWFRSWHGAPTDNKWLAIAKRANVKPIHVSGTWWALLDHASQHSERGTVADFDVETFALFAGMEESHVSRIVTALCEKGLIVDGGIAQWGKRQPKREDETAAARKRRQRERNGGKPPPNGGADIPDHDAESDGHAMSRNVTTDTEQNREDTDSVANATGTIVPHPAASDFCKAVFDTGRALLMANGKDARTAGSLIGRMRKTIGDAEMLTLIREAEIKSEPAEWLIAAVETRNGNRPRNVRLAGQSDLRGSRPDPSLDLLRQARAAEEAERAASDREDHGELGLRYRPSAQADLEAHAESIRLLAEDVADVPAHLLETAAKRWVRENRFMPKASELVALARGQITGEMRGTDAGFRQLQAHCDRLNAMNNGRDGWHVVGEAPNRTIAKAADGHRA